MGTRGLTVVMLDGQYKIAQYGQWDHYPEGQGVEVLDFCKVMAWLDWETFKKRVRACRWVTQAEFDEAMKASGSSDGWMTNEQAEIFKRKLPFLTRDHGACILRLVLQSDEPPVLQDQIDFAKDSWCEWVYVVDLDKGTLEVFRGHSDQPLAEGERFFGPANEQGNYPPRLVKRYELSRLPLKEQFIQECDPSEEDDSEEAA